MKNAIKFLIPLSLAFELATASANDARRIDGTSDEAFNSSFAELVGSLHGYERRQFALGLFGVLAPHKCLSSDAIIHLTFSPVAPTDAPLMRSCREFLQGKSFEDIIREGEPKSAEPQAARPNNSFKPTPLRGSA